MKVRLKKYLWNILVSLDQLANTIFSGYPDETFSARTYRKAQAGQWFWRTARWAVDRIFFWQLNHCRGSYENELKRGHGPREFVGNLNINGVMSPVEKSGGPK